jgi:hypothetical protein
MSNLLRKLKINELLGDSTEIGLDAILLLSLWDKLYSNVAKFEYYNNPQSGDNRLTFYGQNLGRKTFHIITTYYIDSKTLSSRGILESINSDYLLHIDKKDFLESSIFLHKKFIKKYFNIDIDIKTLL